MKGLLYLFVSLVVSFIVNKTQTGKTKIIIMSIFFSITTIFLARIILNPEILQSYPLSMYLSFVAGESISGGLILGFITSYVLYHVLKK